MHRYSSVRVEGNGRRDSGMAAVEFAFILVSLVPILLGATGLGVNLIRTIQVNQLARDAGHLFARGLDVSQPGNQVILTNIGSPLGLSTTSTSSSSELVFSALTYVDKSACAEVGAVDSNGNPLNCTNYGQWVFTQRLVVGSSSMISSSIGSPVTTGANAVTPDPTTGLISPYDYVLQSGAVATFSNSINPYSNVNGVISGLPSGQYLYITEAVATAFTVPPFFTTSSIYAYNIS